MRLMRLFAFLPLILASSLGAQVRIGIVGTDTSHVPAFTKTFNDTASADYIPGFRVVAAYKGGSPDVESSASRVEQYAEQIRSKYGVEIVPDIATLCSKVDVVLLESVDGRKHLEQAREIIKAKKPMFIDKPLASTLADAQEIARLAKAAGVPWFSTSSLRYSDVTANMTFPDTKAAIAWGPGPEEEHHQLDLSWYGIHPVEILFTILGPGCEEVTRTVGKNSDSITCRWSDGRVGTVQTLRPYGDYGAVVFREKTTVRSPEKAKVNYVPMLREIAKFFETKVPPVPNSETLEIFAFMDAAQRSKAAGGKPVKLAK
jgi:hypothetical protein